MNNINKLIQLACDLDAKGLTAEANLLDRVAKGFWCDEHKQMKSECGCGKDLKKEASANPLASSTAYLQHLVQRFDSATEEDQKLMSAGKRFKEGVNDLWSAMHSLSSTMQSYGYSEK